MVAEETHLLVIAVNADNIDQVTEVIGKTLAISFTQRDSSYLGEYSSCKLIDFEIRVYLNRDPLFQAEIDPPDEEFFVPAFKERRVLVSVSGSAEVAEMVNKALQTHFG